MLGFVDSQFRACCYARIVSDFSVSGSNAVGSHPEDVYFVLKKQNNKGCRLRWVGEGQPGGRWRVGWVCGCGSLTG